MKSSNIRKLSLLACVGVFGVGLASTAAFAQAPVKLSIGNGPPLLGNSSSKLGIGVLTSQPNGTPNSVRVLGAEKTVGVYSEGLKGRNGQPTQLQANTPLDGLLAVPRR